MYEFIIALRRIYLVPILIVFFISHSWAADGNGSFGGLGKHSRSASKPYSYKVVTAPNHPVREGRKSYRFELRYGDCAARDCATERERVERQSRANSRIGQEYWYAYSIYLDPTFRDVSPSPTILGQWKQEPVGPQIASLEAERGRLVFLMKDVSSTEGRCCQIDQTVASISSARGRWIDMLVHVKWAADASGFLDVYVNGRRKVSYQGQTAYMPKRGISFRFGVYRSSLSRQRAETPTQIVYYDNVKRGTSRGSVSP